MKKVVLLLQFYLIGIFSINGQNNLIPNKQINKMNNLIKVCAAQVSPVFMDKQKTIEKACATIEEAAKNGAKLIVFPESFVPGYPDWVWLVPNSKSAELNKLFLELIKNAITIPDNSTELLCKAAKANNINVVIGVNERNSESSNSTLFNSLLFINDQGDIIGKHRKLMPTGGERLVWGQGDGSSLNSYQTSVGKLSGLVCWENYMPLARQAIYEQGAQILATPTWDKSDNWLVSIQHIAREGGLFVISACMALSMDDIPDRFDFKKLYPEGREWINTGKSCIIGPNGKVIAGPLEAKEGILYADINLDDIISAKRMFDAVGHYSRSDVFHFEVVKKN